MTVGVRFARDGDLSLLTSLEESLFPDAWGAGAIRSHLASDSAVSLIAEGDTGEALGYLLGLSLVGEGELLRIAVTKPARRAGVGKAILHSFLDILKENGAEACFLEVRKSNEAAIALYRGSGFLPVGERKNYYKNPTEDALLLVLRPL